MPSGGARTNSGPSKGTKYAKANLARDLQREGRVRTAEQIVGTGITPLEYLIKVMRDPKADKKHRIESAKDAAQYIHCRKPQEVILQAEVHIDGVDILIIGK